MNNNTKIFDLRQDIKGYPFFELSSFKIWILYKDKNKRIRYSIETNTTINQLVYGRINNLILDKLEGLNKLIELVNKQDQYIDKAIIYWNGYKGEKNDAVMSYQQNKWTTLKNINKETLKVNYPFVVEGTKIIVNLNQEK